MQPSELRRTNSSRTSIPALSVSLFLAGRLDFAVVCRSDKVVSAVADGGTSTAGATSVCQMFEQNVCRFLWAPPGQIKCDAPIANIQNVYATGVVICNAGDKVRRVVVTAAAGYKYDPVMSLECPGKCV